MNEERTVDQETPAAPVILRRRRRTLPSWTWMAVLGGVALLGLATGGLVVAPQIAAGPKPAAKSATLGGAGSATAEAVPDVSRTSSKEKDPAKDKGKEKEKGKNKDKRRGEGSRGSAEKKGAEPTYIELDNMIVNPAGCEGQHFLMVKVSLGVPDRKLVSGIEGNKTAIQDAIASSLGSYTMEWLVSPGARDSIKVMLADRIAEVTGVSDELTVFLPQFVMQ